MKKHEVGDFLMHESAGVCRVAAVEELALQGRGSEKMYYSLEPVFQTGSHVITPVEGAKVRIRDVKSKKEIENLLSSLDELEFIDENNDRARAEKFKEEISHFDPRPLAGVVKTAYLRKHMRIASGKKVMSSDEKVLQNAGKKLFEEMAFALKTDLDTAADRFYKALEDERVRFVSMVTAG